MSAECVCRWVDEPEVNASWLAAENPACPEHGPMISDVVTTESCSGVSGITNRTEQIMSVDQVLEAARNSPECFKCHEPITEFNDVRIVTVRVDGEPRSAWVHADHAKPDWDSTA